MRDETPALAFALGGIVASGIFLAAVLGGAFNEQPSVSEPTFTAFKVDVNDALDEPFLDQVVECVVILAEVGDARILMAGPCVTTYP